jgi:hypothetical protein
MTPFNQILKELKKQERHLAEQLTSIRAAISSLEFGSAGVPPPAIIDTPHAVRVRSKRSRPTRRTLKKRR